MNKSGIRLSAVEVTHGGRGLATPAMVPADHIEGPVEFLCTVAPGLADDGQLDAVAICASFEREVQRALNQPLRRSGQLPPCAMARWVLVEVGFPRRSAVAAQVSSHLAGSVKRQDPIALDVMDKKLGQREVDRLARLVADSITCW